MAAVAAERPSSSIVPLLVEKTGECRITHPAMRVSCVCSGGGAATTVVTAGGSVISAAYAHHMFTLPETSLPSGHTMDEWARETTCKGADVLLHLTRQWAERDGGASGSQRDPLPTEGSNPCVVLSRGHVTCMAVSEVPGSESALGVAGTTCGSLVLFRVQGASLSKLDEISLVPPTQGRIPSMAVVQDVCIGLDPAGRLEYVAAATASCLVLLDAPPLLGEAVSTERADPEEPSAAPLDPRDVFVAAFPRADVRRLLVPERFHAAFALDVAMVVVLADGTLAYVERRTHGAGRPEARERVGYRLSSCTLHVPPGEAGAASPDRGITVNDAALFYDASHDCMGVVLVGSQASGTGRSGSRGGASRVADDTVAARAFSPLGPPSAEGGGGGGGPGWWAVARHVVLPRHTLRSALIPVGGAPHVMHASSSGARLPRGGRPPESLGGFSTVTVVGPHGRALLSAGRELFVGLWDGAAGPLASPGSALTLLPARSAGAVVEGVAVMRGAGGERETSAVVCATGSTLAVWTL